MKAMQTIGYKEANQFLSGELSSHEDLLFRMICSTRQYEETVYFFSKNPS